MDRRTFSTFIASSAIAARLQFAPSQAQENFEPLNRFPRMMQSHLLKDVRAAHQRSVQAKRNLKTRKDAEAYVQDVRNRIRKSFGPEPDRTPLNARTTGVLNRDGYDVEKIVFESRPNFPVTANLYLPSRADSTHPVPGVVGTCGHSSNGKASEFYQSFSQGLARKGIACLIFDPIGQGERLQYVDKSGKAILRPGTSEHIQAGNQQFLVGENLAMWRAWDGIRALDYLLSRDEINSEHIGVTGNSGGGTMTTWLCGVEQRWTMAAPACFVTTFLRNFENELPADTEQCPPRALALGLEHEDFLIAQAPDPIVILAKERDFFDVRGSEEAYRRIRKVYRLLDADENISLFTGPTDHGFSQENREAMYAWFNKSVGSAKDSREDQILIEKDEDLWCTKSGQVHELRPATVATLTRDHANRLVPIRGNPRGKNLEKLVRDVLRLPSTLPETPPKYRILRNLSGRGYPKQLSSSIYAVETENGIQSLCYMLTQARHQSRPASDDVEAATLYVSHRSSDEELRSEKWLAAIIENCPDQSFFSCDVRGIGESLPNTCRPGSFDSPYGCDYFYAIHGIMLDKPYLGQKTFDLLRVCQWIQSVGYKKIKLIANGWGSYVGTMSALLSPAVASLHIHNAQPSFHELAIDPLYKMPLAYMPPKALEQFDVTDCLAELETRMAITKSTS